MSRKKTGVPQGNASGFGLPHLASLIFNTPLLIDASRLEVILHALSGRMQFDAPSLSDVQRDFADEMAGRVKGEEAYSMRARESFVKANGVGTISVEGPLVNKGSWMSAACGMTSYGWIESALRAALSDDEVERIIFDFDTPGGECAGVFDLADFIFESRGKKPMTAVANEATFSAGYLLASACDEIVVPRTGQVGSIGVVTTHIDRSGSLKQQGLAVTQIFAGAKKIDGSSFGPLSSRARNELVERVDNLYGLFVDSVAKYRGISAASVRATEAGTYMGEEAVAAKLADRVDTIGNEYKKRAGAARTDSTARLSNSTEQIEMTKKTETPAEPKGGAAATNDDAGAATPTPAAETPDAGAAMQARIKTITTHAEAADRVELAQHLAFDTALSADAAIAILAKSPKATPKAAGGRLDALMSAERKPAVGAETDDGGNDPAPRQPKATKDIFAARRDNVTAIRDKSARR